MVYSFRKVLSIDASFSRCLLFSLVFFVTVNGQNISESAIIDDNDVDAKVEKINYRIPNNTKPESYDITLTTNIDRNEFSFSGRVVIKLRVLEASKNITIHSHQFDIKTIKLATTTGTAIKLNPHSYDNVTEFLVIPSQTELQKDAQYSLTIEYSGELRNNCTGFYRTSYENAKNETKQVPS